MIRAPLHYPRGYHKAHSFCAFAPANQSNAIAPCLQTLDSTKLNAEFIHTYKNSMALRFRDRMGINAYHRSRILLVQISLFPVRHTWSAITRQNDKRHIERIGRELRLLAVMHEHRRGLLIVQNGRISRHWGYVVYYSPQTNRTKVRGEFQNRWPHTASETR